RPIGADGIDRSVHANRVEVVRPADRLPRLLQAIHECREGFAFAARCVVTRGRRLDARPAPAVFGRAVHQGNTPGGVRFPRAVGEKNDGSLRGRIGGRKETRSAALRVGVGGKLSAAFLRRSRAKAGLIGLRDRFLGARRPIGRMGWSPCGGPVRGKTRDAEQRRILIGRGVGLVALNEENECQNEGGAGSRWHSPSLISPGKSSSKTTRLTSATSTQAK